MTSSLLVPSRSVLADRVLPRSTVADVALVVGRAGLTAGLAQVAIPMRPVPIAHGAPRD